MVKSVFKPVSLAVFCVMFVGCMEDNCEITLSEDGSGVVRHETTFTERFMVGLQSEGPKSADPPFTKQQVKEKLQGTVELKSLTQKDHPDGSRTIEWEGRFENAAQFFLSDFAVEHLKANITPVGQDQAVISFDMKMGGAGLGIDASKMYALAKGLHVVRKVNLPGKITETNGKKLTGRSAQWAVDLRSREGLKNTNNFLEEAQERGAFAKFDASRIKFKLPLMPEPVKEAIEPETESNADKDAQTNMTAEVEGIKAEKLLYLKDSASKWSGLELIVKISGLGDEKFQYKSELIQAADSEGKNLVPENQWRSVHTGYPSKGTKDVGVKMNNPSKDAEKLVGIRGQVEVITGTDTEKVILEDFRSLEGKENTGNEYLDSVNFKIKKITKVTIKVEIDGGHRMIEKFELVDKTGRRVTKSGGMGFGDTWTYDFNHNVEDFDNIEMQVVVKENKVTLPFEAKEIKLP